MHSRSVGRRRRVEDHKKLYKLQWESSERVFHHGIISTVCFVLVTIPYKLRSFSDQARNKLPSAREGAKVTSTGKAPPSRRTRVDQPWARSHRAARGGMGGRLESRTEEGNPNHISMAWRTHQSQVVQDLN